VIQAFYASPGTAEHMHYLERKLAENLAHARNNFCRLDVLRHGRDVHPAWVNVVTAALALKSFGGQVMRAERMLR
jgi:hypothetical protein